MDDVAVKWFIMQKLDEQHRLYFRAEMAFLSQLHHPNISSSSSVPFSCSYALLFLFHS
jgi:hypothetical protein